MQLLRLTLPTLNENLACDEALLLEAEAGRSAECLRLWEWRRPAVVLGSAGSVTADVDENACRADNVPIRRRSSGGGTVLLGSGCLLFSLILAYSRSEELTQIGCSYCHILGRFREAFGKSIARIELSGISDLALRGRKFSGNAQQRKRSFLLHHGTLLYDFDCSLVARYLPMPARQPAYRDNRDHQSFLMNVDLPRTVVEEMICNAWDASAEIVQWPKERTRQLVGEKYAQSDWIYRR